MDFKIGDRVRIINIEEKDNDISWTENEKLLFIGEEGEVIDVTHSHYPILIKLDCLVSVFKVHREELELIDG